ncbi:hypothetical protein GCM10022402_17450 [Salinactinospora qingdaonensis]|uniref:Tyr recombinase domain-containing protein n=1 Tax=Salinactinospora qingdaonensis TaxID=702744 RepID=A0ABP7FK94_9ACTN
MRSGPGGSPQPERTPQGGCVGAKRRRLEDVHLHDLRHTGNTYAAEAGASLRELMNRLGHSSTRAAMVYLHARDARARELADALGERAARELEDARQSEEPADDDTDGDDAEGDDDGDGSPSAGTDG